MTKQSFRVKPYSHRDYKYVVRVKLDGKWLRRYFRTETEAIAFADEQNAALQNSEANRAPASRGALDMPKPTGQAFSEATRQNVADDSLPWTGERLVTTCQRPIAFEHLHRYGVACALAAGKRVLDIACGEGYGANLLADFAQEVVGIDKDPATIAHATRKYQRSNLRFREGDCAALPLADNSIDLVASFETIEHISAHERFLGEIKRVLAPDGVLVISSPDKNEYAKVSQSANPFHQAELTHEEFVQLVGRMFRHCVIGKQRLVVGSWIAPDGTAPLAAASTFHGGFDRIGIEAGVHRGLYSVAVCSDAELPTVKLGMFENLRESNETWDLLDRYESPANVALRISELQRDNDSKSEQLAQLHRENDQNSRHLVELEDKLIDARWELVSLRAESIRGNEAAAEAVARFTEMENRAKAATSERDQLRQVVVTMLQDLEQERLNTSAMKHQLDEQANNTQDRLLSAQENLRNAENRAAATLDELQTIQAQAQIAHEHLLTTGKELVARRKQISLLRKRLRHRLILPVGKAQNELEELTR